MGGPSRVVSFTGWVPRDELGTSQEARRRIFGGVGGWERMQPAREPPRRQGHARCHLGLRRRCISAGDTGEEAVLAGGARAARPSSPSNGLPGTVAPLYRAHLAVEACKAPEAELDPPPARALLCRPRDGVVSSRMETHTEPARGGLEADRPPLGPWKGPREAGVEEAPGAAPSRLAPRGKSRPGLHHGQHERSIRGPARTPLLGRTHSHRPHLRLGQTSSKTRDRTCL